MRKTKDFAFVHFSTRASAEQALAQSHNLIIDQAEVEVTVWVLPLKVLIKHRNPPNFKINVVDFVIPLKPFLWSSWVWGNNLGFLSYPYNLIIDQAEIDVTIWVLPLKVLDKHWNPTFFKNKCSRFCYTLKTFSLINLKLRY